MSCNCGKTVGVTQQSYNVHLLSNEETVQAKILDDITLAVSGVSYDLHANAVVEIPESVYKLIKRIAPRKITEL